MLDFQQFFHLITTYSLYTREQIFEFVFQTFDKNNSGQIDEDEFLDLARTVTNADVRQANKKSDFFHSKYDHQYSFLSCAKYIFFLSLLQPMFPGNFKSALEQFDHNDDGMLDFEEFKLVSLQTCVI